MDFSLIKFCWDFR